MGTPDDPWDVDYEYEDDQEAVSKKQNPDYKPGKWEKEKGELLGDWVNDDVQNGGTSWDWGLSEMLKYIL